MGINGKNIVEIMKTFYKYKSLEKFLFFVDIIINNRLYAAMYRKLNDKMEGHYDRIGERNADVSISLRADKENLKICSLTTSKNNEKMWCNYADKHKGVVIVVEIDENRYKPERIIYDFDLPSFSHQYYSQGVAKEILCHKTKKWSYEEEIRIFAEGEQYVDVQVKEIITGKGMTNEDYELIKQLIQKINPEIKVNKET
jgi:hypothetical protein